VDIRQRIAQQFEEAARFICQVLGYTLTDVRLMNCYTFHRELNAANKQQEEQRKSAEKWSR